eukprot:CAMPEP_0204325444 /NCGR_PEP_ID=MMETSP0469-20131031/11031_1 /ASSEMBLY_ACC=CAM_ASM_000384 /TAXON_ID=2969 /ORGANISM="Oxyrrhis marina" /LENGTH=96 /DNA_ID=CAMNT_0051307301 /DNA_START=230 /DNA_END=520 /DNA_ORIENTATION=+
MAFLQVLPDIPLLPDQKSQLDHPPQSNQILHPVVVAVAQMEGHEAVGCQHYELRDVGEGVEKVPASGKGPLERELQGQNDDNDATSGVHVVDAGDE